LSSSSSSSSSRWDVNFLVSTLRLTQAGERRSNFSKALLDLSTAQHTGWFTYKQVINVHSPIRRMCGRRKQSGSSGSSADFLSSILRIHHYRAGTTAMQHERSNDYRGPNHQESYNFHSNNNDATTPATTPDAEATTIVEYNNTDILDWYPWFVQQFTPQQVQTLLLDPLEQAYKDYFYNHVMVHHNHHHNNNNNMATTAHGVATEQ